MKKITLCLSGGGFRASIFHLGVIKALRVHGLLDKIQRIYSVSGGAILAAHLVLNWERYASSSHSDEEFERAVTELVSFIRSDVRGRIVRRWVFLGWIPRFSRINQLVRLYDRLYKGALLEALSGSNRPELFILATSMISGDLCAFTSRALIRNYTNGQRPVLLPHLKVAEAVAASSAFPPMFPCFRVDRKRLSDSGEMLADEVLTDGGVFDNLGVRAALHDGRGGQESLVIVSDASGAFRTDADPGYSIVSRTMRSTDILMNRIALMEKNSLSEQGFIFASIERIIERSELPVIVGAVKATHLPQPVGVQQWIKTVRTDLDVFSDMEIRMIYLHGLEVGLQALGKEKARYYSLPYDWDPSMHQVEAADRPLIQLQETLKEMRRQRPSFGVRESDARQPTAAEISTIRDAARRRSRIWNAKDPLCWTVLIVALAVVVFFLYRSCCYPA